MDYYPFGMLLPNRHKSSSSYRYGFQGQEKDDELKGEGNSMNYKFRMHDTRIGRFFARDPLEKKYPYLTPYQFSSNTPVMAIELEGLESSTNVNSNETTESNTEDTSLYEGFGSGSLLSMYGGAQRIDYFTQAYRLKGTYSLGSGNYDFIGGKEARFKLKFAVRENTINPFREMLNKFEGTVERSTKPTPRFWKTNLGYNILGGASYSLGTYNTYMSLQRISESDDPLRQTAIEGSGQFGAWAFMRASAPYALKQKNKYLSGGIMIGSGIMGGWISYKAADLGISEADYTNRMLTSLEAKGIIIIKTGEKQVNHNNLHTCPYCNGKAVDSWVPSYYFYMTDPSNWHPENYEFTESELKFGVGWDKVAPKYKD